jgi:hypothetical protein
LDIADAPFDSSLASGARRFFNNNNNAGNNKRRRSAAMKKTGRAALHFLRELLFRAPSEQIEIWLAAKQQLRRRRTLVFPVFFLPRVVFYIPASPKRKNPAHTLHRRKCTLKTSAPRVLIAIYFLRILLKQLSQRP